MLDAPRYSETGPIVRAVYVEACHDGVNPATMVRIVYKRRKGPDAPESEQRRLFDTLEEALAFAQSLCAPESESGH